MNEDYVSFEVAKMLKEKGFDWKCENRFVEKIPGTEREEWDEDECAYVTKTNCNIYPKPTLYMAQKWLRETKGIYIWVEPVIGHRWTVSFCDLNVCAEESDWIERELHKDGYPIYDSYEDALNAGILKALKSI